MSRAGAAAAALLAVGVLCAPAASAEDLFLNSAYDAVAFPPPLPPGSLAQQTPAEFRNPGRVDTREHVAVGVGPDGAPVRVTVVQELRLRGTGDYSFVVPAPATSVQAGPGSESQPGLRNVGIVWQGFSDRRRLLSARATLRPEPAAKGLPLRVAISRRGSSTVVRLEDVARRRVKASTGSARRTRLVRVLEAMRAAYPRTGFATAPLYVGGGRTGSATLDVAAPLRVTGTISAGGPGTKVDVLLGGRRSLSRSFALRGPATPTVDLRVELLSPLAILPTRAALLHGPEPVLAFQRALGAASTSWAYREYLLAPDSAGSREIAYRYRSLPAARAAAAAARDGGNHTLTIVLALVLGGAALVGLAILWARS